MFTLKNGLRLALILTPVLANSAPGPTPAPLSQIETEHPELSKITDPAVKQALIELIAKQKKGVLPQDLKKEDTEDSSKLESMMNAVNARMKSVSQSYSKWRRGTESNFEVIA